MNRLSQEKLKVIGIRMVGESEECADREAKAVVAV